MPPVHHIALCNVFGGLIYGYTGVGVNNPLGTLWGCQYSIAADADTTWLALLVSSINFGACTSCILSNHLIRALGTKWSLVVANCCCCLTIGLMMTPPYAVQVLLHIAVGFGVGLISCASPTYVSETAPVHLRGTLGSLFQVDVALGILLSSIVGYLVLGSQRDLLPDAYCHSATEHEIWWRGVWLQLPAVLLSIAMMGLSFRLEKHSQSSDYQPLVVEPVPLQRPRSQSIDPIPNTSAELTDQAKRAGRGLTHDSFFAPPTPARHFPWLNPPVGFGSYSGFSQTFSQALLDEAELSHVPLKSALKPLTIGVLLALLLQFSGINAVIFYSGSFFEAAGVSAKALGAIFVMGWNFLSTLLALVLVDRLGRRWLLLPSLYLLFIALMAMALVNTYVTHPPTKAGACFVLLACVLTGFEVGPGSLFWIVAAEVFPPNLIVKGFVICNSVGWIACILVTLCFPALHLLLGNNVFYIFGVPGLAMTLFLTLVLPETKGLSKAQITSLLANTGWVTFWAARDDSLTY
eukprot:NODE_950_length_1747_cov_31.094444_g890_i0.p1 GENE.NODE_950_length_1747_cov_31.094444_g890_i0~~NODE_950_length_1747_cov_31.094444_g890_i0.p1  ORF type:complete len:566 (-),score=138.73 NODE_950_length_1747_cov_31.094444_g890_i0:48-1610(-)